MPVKTITARIDGQQRTITANIPDGASNEDIMSAVSAHLSKQPKFSAVEREAANQANLKRYTEDPGIMAGIGAELQNLNPITMIKGAYDMVTSPIETGKRIMDLQGQQFTKAGEQFKRGNYVQAGGAALAGMVPLVGPAAQEAGEDIAAGRTGYGIGKGLTMIGATLAPRAITNAAKSKPVMAARDAVAGSLKESAAAQYGRALNPTKQGTKYLSKTQTVPGLIDRGVKAVTMSGLKDKVSTQVSKLGEAIGNYWDELPADAKAPVNEIIERIRKDSAEVQTVTTASGKTIPMSKTAGNAMDSSKYLADLLESVAEVDSRGVKLVPVKELRKLRQHWDELAADAKRYEGKALLDKHEGMVHGRAADAIREEFAKADPSLAALNKEFSFWKNAEKVVDETILRREGQARPLGRKIAEAAGTAVGATSGPVGALLGKYGMGLLEKVVTSPAWNTFSAIAKDRLANAIATGKKGKAIIELEKLRKEAASSTALVPRNATPTE